MHGGKSPNAVAAAKVRGTVREAKSDAAAVLAYEGLRAVGDPLEELSRLAQEAAAFKDALARRVNALSFLEVPSSSSAISQLRHEVLLYERAMDRTGKFMELLVRSGFEERRVRISEEQGRMIAGVFQRALPQLLAAVLTQAEDAGLVQRIERVWSEAVGEVLPRELRAAASVQVVRDE
jgi:hypothetical protein